MQYFMQKYTREHGFRTGRARRRGFDREGCGAKGAAGATQNAAHENETWLRRGFDREGCGAKGAAGATRNASRGNETYLRRRGFDREGKRGF